MHSAIPFIFLGITYAVMGLLWFMVLTFFAGSFSAKLKSNAMIGTWLNKFSSLAFVLMGIKIALTKK
jgi:threonine/homoserine/homoserine lactone efflux protein